MGRKKKELLKKESQEREQLRRYDRFLALSDTLTEKVGVALDATEPLDTKELKQISGILKELMGMQEMLSPEARREREAKLRRLERELESTEDTCEVTVHFVGGEQEYTV